jgi:predicted ATPase
MSTPPYFLASDGLLGLVAKSLVVTEGKDAVARYRLLDTTRACAREMTALPPI